MPEILLDAGDVWGTIHLSSRVSIHPPEYSCRIQGVRLTEILVENRNLLNLGETIRIVWSLLNGN